MLCRHGITNAMNENKKFMNEEDGTIQSLSISSATLLSLITNLSSVCSDLMEGNRHSRPHVIKTLTSHIKRFVGRSASWCDSVLLDLPC